MSIFFLCDFSSGFPFKSLLGIVEYSYYPQRVLGAIAKINIKIFALQYADMNGTVVEEL